MKKTFFMMAMAIASISVSAQNKSNVDTLYVTTTPQMHCSGCENKIKSNIRFVKGIKKIETSVPEQKVTLIYDNRKSDFKTIEAAFKKIGYSIKEVAAIKENSSL